MFDDCVHLSLADIGYGCQLGQKGFLLLLQTVHTKQSNDIFPFSWWLLGSESRKAAQIGEKPYSQETHLKFSLELFFKFFVQLLSLPRHLELHLLLQIFHRRLVSLLQHQVRENGSCQPEIQLCGAICQAFVPCVSGFPGSYVFSIPAISLLVSLCGCGLPPWLWCAFLSMCDCFGVLRSVSQGQRLWSVFGDRLVCTFEGKIGPGCLWLVCSCHPSSGVTQFIGSGPACRVDINVNVLRNLTNGYEPNIMHVCTYPVPDKRRSAYSLCASSFMDL